MAHKVTFYNLGNADSTLLELENGKKILFDFANVKSENDSNDKRCDLPFELNKVVKDDFDVVCFTHADKDHVFRFSEYFYLEHAKKYQDGERKKIKELWIPAHLITDTDLKEEDAKILRQEARFRLKNKTNNVRVFSRPEKFKAWCEKQTEIVYDDIKHLIVDAGKCVPGFENKESNDVELFVHSPFASETQSMDRNSQAIVIQATFNNKSESKLILGADIDCDVWADIIKITKHFKREFRLEWDIFHVSHHSSYTALSTEKGKDKTIPEENIKWMFEKQGKSSSIIVSPSKPIPLKNSKEDEDVQPPHRQAANYYIDVMSGKAGEFIVTMEYPTKEEPEPIVFELRSQGIEKLKTEKQKLEAAKKVLTTAPIKQPWRE